MGWAAQATEVALPVAVVRAEQGWAELVRVAVGWGAQAMGAASQVAAARVEQGWAALVKAAAGSAVMGLLGEGSGEVG